MSRRRLGARRLSLLARWRDWVTLLERALDELGLEGARVHVVGGVAEGRMTVASDIDVVVELPQEPSFEEAVELRTRIWEKLEQLGVPLEVPLEIYLRGPRHRGKEEPARSMEM